MIGVYNPDRFIKDSKLQEAAFSAYTARNKWILRRDIKRYAGRTIAGVRVTESGILAAAHLAGPGNVKKAIKRSGGNTNYWEIRQFLPRETSKSVRRHQQKKLSAWRA